MAVEHGSGHRGAAPVTGIQLQSQGWLSAVTGVQFPSQGCSSSHKDAVPVTRMALCHHRGAVPVTGMELQSQGWNSRHKDAAPVTGVGKAFFRNHLWLLPVGAITSSVVLTGQGLSCLGELSLCYPVNHLVRERFDCRFEEAHKVTVLIYDILLEVP